MTHVIIIEFNTDYEFNTGTELILKLFQKDKTDKLFIGSFDIKFNRNECLKHIAYTVLNLTPKHNEIYLACLSKDVLEVEKTLVSKGCYVDKMPFQELLRSL